MALSISLTVNGKAVTATVEPHILLVQFLREELGLTGTHVGCDTAQCGACTVHLDGRAIKSCNILAVQADASSVTTIEGMAKDGELHPMQAAFKECHGLQCGFCTPGMLLMARDILQRLPNADPDAVRHELSGQICRCTGYTGIIKAIVAAGQELASARSSTSE
jgi:aerobic carbon-monoxide dehydrogenase small subunit